MSLDSHSPFPVASTSSPTRPKHRRTSTPRPIPNSYWATPTLLACEYPWSPKDSVPKLDALLRVGVRTFIDLTEEGELQPYAPHWLGARAELLGIEPAELEYHSFPIVDRSLPQSVQYMCHILDVLSDNETRGRVTAVHCRGGIGRTGMVVGCYLVECGLVRNGEEALRRIAEEWCTVEKCKRFPHSPETGPQFDFVKNFRKVRCRQENANTAGVIAGLVIPQILGAFKLLSVMHAIGQSFLTLVYTLVLMASRK